MSTAEKLETDAPVEERRDPSRENNHRRSIFSVPVTVSVAIGSQRMTVSEILDLREESIIPLLSRIEDPVDLVVDNRVIARGDLIETDDGGLAVRITEIPETGDDKD